MFFTAVHDRRTAIGTAFGHAAQTSCKQLIRPHILLLTCLLLLQVSSSFGQWSSRAGGVPGVRVANVTALSSRRVQSYVRPIDNNLNDLLSISSEVKEKRLTVAASHHHKKHKKHHEKEG